MYGIDYHDDVQKDLKKLGHRISILALNKIQKIAKNPTIGDNLGNKANLDLSGLKKVYIDNKRVRIVYKIIEEKVVVFVIAVGKRDDMQVYKKALGRCKSNY